MMLRIPLFILFLCSINLLCAQTRPIFLPEDIESTTLKVKCLCKPGVENKSRSKGLDISYQHVFGSEIGEEGNTILKDPRSQIGSLQNLIMKLKIPVLNKEGFKVLLGYTYRPEQYNFDLVGADFTDIFNHLDVKRLKSSGFEAIVSKSLNEKFYTSFRFRALYNGDYNGFLNLDDRYAVYSLTSAFGIKKHKDYEWGVGINFAKSFRRTIALPFVFFNKNFNEKWGIESVLPAMILLRYNAAPGTLLFAGPQYNSRSYAIETTSNGELEPYDLNHSELRFSLELEQNLLPWVWLNVEGGYQMNFSTDFDAKNNNDLSFKVEPGNSPYIRIGLFISPPDSFFK